MSDTIKLTEPTYQGDAEELAQLSDGTRERFDVYMRDLDAEHARRGQPYGSGSLWTVTGASCWLGYFFDDYSPGDAMNDDLCCDDE